MYRHDFTITLHLRELLKVLLISYLLPPVVNPQSILSARVAKYLQMAGHEVTVLGATDAENLNSTHGVDTSLNFDLRDVRVWRVPDRAQEGVVAGVLKKVVNHERSGYWVSQCVREALHGSGGSQFDVIYSLAYPMASNIVGMRLKQKVRIPWVAHFSDPGFLAFNLRFKSPIRTYLTRSTELSIFRYADGVTFVNQQTLIRNTTFNPAYREKCAVIPHLFDPDCFRGKQDSRVDRKTLRLSYIGSLYGKRNPFNAILALDRAMATVGQGLSNAEFHLYGAIDPDIQTRLEKEWRLPWVKLYGPIDYDASIQAMFDSDYLILLDWSGEDNLYFPSKLVDYLAACRPIIGITPMRSYSAGLLRDLKYPVFDPGDVDGLTQFFCGLITGTRLDIASRHLEVLGDFRAEHVVEQLAHFLTGRAKAKPS